MLNNDESGGASTGDAGEGVKSVEWPDQPGSPSPPPLPGGKTFESPDTRGWIVLHVGLSICYYSLLLQICALVLSFVCIAAVWIHMKSLPGFLFDGGWLTVFFGLSLLLWAISGIALVVGWLVCLRVPTASEARLEIQVAVSCLAAAILVLLVLPLVLSMFGPIAPDQQLPWQMPMNERDKVLENRENQQRIAVLGQWFFEMAMAGSIAAFAVFLGCTGGHLGNKRMPKTAFIFGSALILFTLVVLVFETLSGDSLGKKDTLQLERFFTPILGLIAVSVLLTLVINARRLTAPKCQVA